MLAGPCGGPEGLPASSEINWNRPEAWALHMKDAATNMPHVVECPFTEGIQTSVAAAFRI